MGQDSAEVRGGPKRTGPCEGLDEIIAKRSSLEREIGFFAWGIVLIMALMLVAYAGALFQGLDGMEWAPLGIIVGMFLGMILMFQRTAVRLSRDQTELLTKWLQDDASQE